MKNPRKMATAVIMAIVAGAAFSGSLVLVTLWYDQLTDRTKLFFYVGQIAAGVVAAICIHYVYHEAKRLTNSQLAPRVTLASKLAERVRHTNGQDLVIRRFVAVPPGALRPGEATMVEAIWTRASGRNLVFDTNKPGHTKVRSFTGGVVVCISDGMFAGVAIGELTEYSGTEHTDSLVTVPYVRAELTDLLPPLT